MKANTIVILLLPILLAVYFTDGTASYGTSVGHVATVHAESDEYHGRPGDEDDDDNDNDEETDHKKLYSRYSGSAHAAQSYNAPAYVAAPTYSTPAVAAATYSAPLAVTSDYAVPAYEVPVHNTEDPFLPYWLRSG
ncbi:uncharacterized protein LOC130703767 [Daphnia carinata]|uniref:uncharacterized protein LOC130703767 n=1 Tax=Daphnia carinata TaxID=120202 RepID=UPI00257D7EAC|nr:uncharacterized protein LOC130703767 [Daphnia carinata]